MSSSSSARPRDSLVSRLGLRGRSYQPADLPPRPVSWCLNLSLSTHQAGGRPLSSHAPPPTTPPNTQPPTCLPARYSVSVSVICELVAADYRPPPQFKHSGRSRKLAGNQAQSLRKTQSAVEAGRALFQNGCFLLFFLPSQA